MKKLLSIIILGLFFMVLGCEKDSLFEATEFESDTPVTIRDINEPFPPQVEDAINAGVDWILTQQNPNGSFDGSGEQVAKTALAVTKLCDRSVELDPSTPPLDGVYGTQIQLGLDYIFGKAYSNSGGGIYLSDNANHSVYNTGIAMMAITAARCLDCVVTTSGILNGLKYNAVLQQTVDFFVAAQNPDGGWRYYDHSQASDNSNTGFAVLGLMAAEKAGIEIPPSLKDNLNGFIDAIQHTNGGSKYTTGSTSMINVLKTGNLLFEMAFVGDNSETPRVLSAINYIQDNWNASAQYPGWKPNDYLAMYCMMKGFEAIGVDNIIVGGEEVSWYDEFWAVIVGNQNDDGYWPTNHYLNPFLSTAFNLLTLEKITPVPYKEVCLDIKPTSCPNPFNMDANGVLPVAILGSEDFDVGSINIESILLEGVAPIRSNYEDVTAPVVDPEDACDCTTAGPDGYLDLTLKFYRQDIADILGDVEDGQMVELTITGETVDGVAIIGSDCIRILKKGKKGRR